MEEIRYNIGGKEFERMLSFGFAALTEKEEEINKLNVFPVPDGDTGKNMRMTYESGLSALKKSGAESVGEAAKVFAKGMLWGARGNSGVILSQIFKGISLGLEGCDVADADRIITAFERGVEKSYKAVIKPVEGTMLTVFRESSDCAKEHQGRNLPLAELFKDIAMRCESSLIKTPELLPVLKDAGVVDSGGAGILCIFQGFADYFSGEKQRAVNVYGAAAGEIAAADSEQEYGYCTEFLLQLSQPARGEFCVSDLVAQLENLGGESIVALRDEDIVKVHVHVKTPGDVLNVAQQYGDFVSIKIENMTLQHSELIKEKAPAVKERLKVAVVIVAADDGFKDMFFDMGADYVVSGGQSMNPSVQDFLKAFDEVNAADIIVLPDNSNVILTAKQAAEIYEGSRVHVLEVKNLSQGYSALSIYNPDEPLEDILSAMDGAKDGVVAMEITSAVRDARCDGVDIKSGDLMAIVNGKVVCAEKDEEGAFCAAMQGLDCLDDKCVITLFCGSCAAQSVTDSLCSYVRKNCPSLEICVMQTNQQVYDYIVAIE